MSDEERESDNLVRGAGRPSKRRRVSDDEVDLIPTSTSRFDASGDDRPAHSLSIRRGRQPSFSPAETPDARDENHDSPRPTSHASSPPRRSRSRSSRRERSYSHSHSRSRSRSRTRSRTPTSDRSPSLSRSQTRSPSPPQFDSHSPSRAHSQASSPSPQPRSTEKRKPNFQPHLRLTGHSAAISQVRISPDGRWLASASADGTAKIWAVETGEHMDTLVGHMAGVSCLTWAPDSDGLATGGDDKAIRLWDRVTASPAHAVGEGAGRGEEAGFGTMRRRVNGGVLRTKAGAKGARGTKNGRGPLLGHHNYVYCLAFSPKGNILASGSYDEAVFLWDVRAGRQMRSLPAHSDPVSGIDFSRDGTLVASCSTDGLIRIWDTSTGQCLRTLVHEDNPPVTNICFSPNGKFVLAFSLDSSIRLWQYLETTQSVKKTYQGHKNVGFSIGGAFGILKDANDENDRGDAFVASASEDGGIVMWDVKSKEIVQRIFSAHEGVCFWVDVNGDVMASAGQDGVVKVFRDHHATSPGKGMNGANGVVANGFSDADTVDDELQQLVENGATPPMKQEIKEEEEL